MRSFLTPERRAQILGEAPAEPTSAAADQGQAGDAQAPAVGSSAPAPSEYGSKGAASDGGNQSASGTPQSPPGEGGGKVEVQTQVSNYEAEVERLRKQREALAKKYAAPAKGTETPPGQKARAKTGTFVDDLFSDDGESIDPGEVALKRVTEWEQKQRQAEAVKEFGKILDSEVSLAVKMYPDVDPDMLYSQVAHNGNTDVLKFAKALHEYHAKIRGTAPAAQPSQQSQAKPQVTPRVRVGGSSYVGPTAEQVADKPRSVKDAKARLLARLQGS